MRILPFPLFVVTVASISMGVGKLHVLQHVDLMHCCKFPGDMRFPLPGDGEDRGKGRREGGDEGKGKDWKGRSEWKERKDRREKGSL